MSDYIAYGILLFLCGFACGLGVKMDKERNKNCNNKGKQNIPMSKPKVPHDS